MTRHGVALTVRVTGGVLRRAPVPGGQGVSRAARLSTAS